MIKAVVLITSVWCQSLFFPLERQAIVSLFVLGRAARASIAIATLSIAALTALSRTREVYLVLIPKSGRAKNEICERRCTCYATWCWTTNSIIQKANGFVMAGAWSTTIVHAMSKGEEVPHTRKQHTGFTAGLHNLVTRTSVNKRMASYGKKSYWNERWAYYSCSVATVVKPFPCEALFVVTINTDTLERRNHAIGSSTITAFFNNFYHPKYSIT